MVSGTATASTSASVSAPGISAGALSSAFAAGAMAYAIKVPPSLAKLLITPTKAGGNLTVSLKRIPQPNDPDPEFNVAAAESAGTSVMRTLALQPGGKSLIWGALSSVSGVVRGGAPQCEWTLRQHFRQWL